MESLGLSERKACQLVNISSLVFRYEAKPRNDDEVRRRIRELAEQRKRFGSPRLHIMLKREKLVINHKRTERIYHEEGLALRRKRRRKGAAGVRVVLPFPQRINERWSMDFVTESIITGRKFCAWLSLMITQGNALRLKSIRLSVGAGLSECLNG